MRKWSVMCVAVVALQCMAGTAEPVDSATSDSLPTAEQIIGRYVDAVGGRDAIGRLSTRVLVGRRITDLEWTPPVYEVVPIVTYSESSGCYLMVEHKADGVRCEGFDGSTAWVQDPEGLRPDTPPVNRTLSWLTDPHNALRLSDYFPALEMRAQEYIDGRLVYVVDPVGLDRTYYSLYFDVDTGLLIRIGYYTELQDYREVDGVLFPFRVSQSRKGGSTTFIFDLAAHNLVLDSSLFAVPASGEDADR